ncbi:hypothetical protein E3A20_06180 [Planctomyces bekefii]|uniref:Outer membrane protein beta-barrel domain-containing protein n=1 Tax=Planctomyces bekefii TaxID=1653850 RepID=A0A5C6MCK7_9PLAN|nr:hypothetical protein E3A20_06180 [Planctomyces bekefii]
MTKKSLLILAAISFSSSTVQAEALSTTSAGMGMRTISYTQAKAAGQTEAQSTQNGTQKTEALNNPILCQRVSTPSSLGLEIGAGGCVHGGGTQTFAYSVSSHLQLIYYPLASRSRIDDDAAVHVNRMMFGDLYLIAQGGLAKISHAEITGTPRTLATDIFEVGGGLGWSYRIFSKSSLGIEAYYLIGSFLSKATTGTTSMMEVAFSMTMFL